jgi:hypothetical protein
MAITLDELDVAPKDGPQYKPAPLNKRAELVAALDKAVARDLHRRIGFSIHDRRNLGHQQHVFGAKRLFDLIGRFDEWMTGRQEIVGIDDDCQVPELNEQSGSHNRGRDKNGNAQPDHPFDKGLHVRFVLP